MSNLPEPFPAAKVAWLKAPTRNADADNKPVAELVATILADVKTRGDVAVREYSAKFDQSDLQVFEVTQAEREAAVAALDPQTRKDTEFAIANVRRFAEAQLATILPLDIEALPGVFMGHRVIPIDRVGCYVPGGRFPLLSAPIMTIVPAKVAGVSEVIACLPPNAHIAMVAGCHLSGADRIFRIGGAQAIAAMAYGTETVPAVMKIMGPGNAFVNEAKRQVFGPVGIDQLAGPSEIYILADATAHAAAPAWRDYGEIAVCEDEAAMIAYSDFIAAEHLQVHTADPHGFAKKLRNYGSLFIGELASVVYSDKCSGTNHTLPTMAAGRYTGGLWVGAYVKIATHQWLEPHGVEAVAPPAAPQAASEGLEGHRRAAQLRLGPHSAPPSHPYS